MSRSIHLARTVGLALVVAVGTASLAFAGPRTPAPQPPSDSFLKDRIEYRLEASDIVHPYDIKVKVDAGAAWLSGTVATAAQKDEAIRLAKIDGVKSVANDIAIDTNVDRTLTEKAKAGMTKTGEKATDLWITSKVKWFFVGEDLLKGADINVHTTDHVVTLQGTVRTVAGRDRAISLATRTGGVHRVVNQLTIGVN